MTMKTASSPSAIARQIPRSALLAALLAASARLAVMLSIAALLVIVLLNAIADALVYAIAGVLALFLSSCAPSAIATPNETSTHHTRAVGSAAGHHVLTSRGMTRHSDRPRIFQRHRCRPVLLSARSP